MVALPITGRNCQRRTTRTARLFVGFGDPISARPLLSTNALRTLELLHQHLLVLGGCRSISDKNVRDRRAATAGELIICATVAAFVKKVSPASLRGRLTMGSTGRVAHSREMKGVSQDNEEEQ